MGSGKLKAKSRKTKAEKEFAVQKQSFSHA